MILFECPNCLNPVYFENTNCENCKMTLGYLPKENRMLALNPMEGPQWKSINPEDGIQEFCANHIYQSCNWLLHDPHPEQLCIACKLNGTIPNLDNPKNLSAWRKIEVAKHRLVYSLLRLNLPVLSKEEDQQFGLEFDFLADTYQKSSEPVITGHSHGRITLNIKEADPVYRERSRKKLGERYRTLIGHFRHEIGHYYWDVLIRSQPEAFRALFGDERLDYGEALESYYADGPPDHWGDTHISPYATMHPWEDWAECWAHYLHLVDSLETGYAFGISLHPRVQQHTHLSLETCMNPYNTPDFESIISQSMSLIFAVNSINRSMGQPDLYPFVVSARVVEKLKFIHYTIQNHTL